MSTSYQPGSRVIRAFSDSQTLKSIFFISDLAVKAAKSEMKKAFQRQRRLGLAAG